MAEFSGSIDTAYYVNEEYSLIEVVYTNPNGEKINYMVEADDNADYKALVEEGYDLETLLDRTSEYKRVHNSEFNAIVNTMAKSLAEEMIGTTVLQKEYAKTQDQLEEAKGTMAKFASESEQKLAKIGGEEFDAIQRSKNTIFQFIWDADENRDELFKFKLWALELDFVKSADKTVKSSLRKAKTIIDGLVILKSIK
tara:strand:- start:879 stop:1469 length:591 start_codon:yes stop_codon:yes gene_type:complete